MFDNKRSNMTRSVHVRYVRKHDVKMSYYTTQLRRVHCPISAQIGLVIPVTF